MASTCIAALLLLLLSYVTADDNLSLETSDNTVYEETDPRFLLILPTGAGNLLNINTTAALLALLGSAALLTALGFLIYYVVSWKLSSVKGYGGSYGGYSGGSGSYGGYGSSYGGSGSYGYARSSDSIDWESLNILDYISMMEEMWRKFDVRDVECQKRVLCELHQNEKALGPAATKVVNAIGYMRYLSLFNLPGDLRGLFEEYQDAADKGRSLKKDCGDIYDTCNFSFKETYMKYVGKNDKNALDN